MRWHDSVKDAVIVADRLRDADLKQFLAAITNPLSVFLCLALLSACASTPGTQDRTVRQGSDVVEKACTEKPQGYTSKVEAELKSKLPLTMVPEPEVEGLVRNYVTQQPKGSDLDEVLKTHMFYVCQMANNGGWNAETTERIIRVFWDHSHEQSSQAVPAIDKLSKLTIEAVNDPISRLPQDNQPQPPRVFYFNRIRVTNVGRQPISNVQLVVLKVGAMQSRFHLPVAAIDNLFEFPGPRVPSLAADLSPGDDKEFEAVVECNGIATMKCPKGKLAIFALESGNIIFVSPIQDGNERLDEFTVRATGEGAAAAIKTFLVSRDGDGLIVLKDKPDK